MEKGNSGLSNESHNNPERKKAQSPEKRNILESVYKSRITRAAALAAVIFGGVVAERIQKNHQKERGRENTVATEALRKYGLHLEDLADKFKVEVQVPGGEKTILHISQDHLYEGIEKYPKEKQIVIKSQKNIEKLLSYLNEKGVSDTVYVEGVTPEYKKLLDNVKSLIADNHEDSKDNVVADSVLIMNYSAHVEHAPRIDLLQDNARAHFLYAAKCELERQYNQIKTEYQIFQQTGHAKKRYQKTFEHFIQEKNDIIRSMENIKERAEEIGANELISGDNIYLWGAAEKMYAEGKIKLESAEDPIAREKTMAPYSLGDYLLSIPKMGYKPAYRHSIREGAAINFIVKNIPKEKVIPLIFGEEHSFTESVQGFNIKNRSMKFGLAKLTPETTSK